MGGYYSSTAGSTANVKLRAFDDNAGSIYGLGVSAAILEFHTPTSSNFAFYEGGTSRFFIKTGGKVGIGSTNPTNQLEINNGGTISYPNNDIVYANANGQTYLNNGVEALSYMYSTMNLGFYAQQTLIMVMTPTAVGIGTTGPAYPLDVNGSCHATCFPTSSDVRFKKNIVPLENALEKVLALRGVSYEWNEFIHSIRNGYDLNIPIIGMIAQEVAEIIPQIVGTWKLNDELTDAKSLEYQRIVPYLVEAIKEQQKQIDQLKSDVKTLMNK